MQRAKIDNTGLLGSVYLAGPDVFLRDQSVATRKINLLNEAGFEGFYPVDTDQDAALSAKSIYENNLDLIDASSIVMANISPFRGPHCDPGTAFELGYAIRQNKHVIAYTNDDRPLKERIECDYSAYAASEIIEDFGLVDNLMLMFGLRVVAESDIKDLSAWKAFKKAVCVLTESNIS